MHVYNNVQSECSVSSVLCDIAIYLHIDMSVGMICAHGYTYVYVCMHIYVYI